MATKIVLASAPAPSGQAAPAAVPAVGMRALDLDRKFYDPSGQLIGSINSVREEIDNAFADMKTAYNREPDEVMRFCAGHSARLSELRVLINRIEDVHRQWRPIRTREIELALDELQNQNANASRRLSARELDWKIESGGRS